MIPDTWRSSRARPIIYSYLIDWVIVIIMAVVWFTIDNVEPYHREFSLTDPSLMYTYSPHDSVPVWLLAIICFVIPAIIIAVISVFYYKSSLDLNHGLLGLCLSLTICAMLTDVTKYITVGRPRPDFLHRCQPPADAHDPPMGLSNYTICTVDSNTDIMIDGFKSFFSGHTSFSFGGLTYFSLYLGGKFNLFDQKGEGRTLKIFIFWIPILGALLIGISRFRDYRHHWSDILIGGIVGVVCAFFAYRQYYPPLYEGGNPYNSRILRHNRNFCLDEEAAELPSTQQPTYHDDDCHPPLPTTNTATPA